MKTKVLLSSILVVSVLLFSNCKKQCEPTAMQNNNATTQNADDYSSIMSSANDEFINITVSGGTETESFYVVNDGLPEIYLLDENSLEKTIGTKDTKDTKGVGSTATKRSFQECLMTLGLNKEQTAQVKRNLQAYEKCKVEVLVRHRNALKELIMKAELSRLELIKKVKNNVITRAQYNEAMKSLHTRVNNEIKALVVSEAKAMNDCLNAFLATLKTTLTARQMEAFIKCYGRK